MSTFESFLNERVHNGKEAEKRLPYAQLKELRAQWEKRLSSTDYMAWFIALSSEEQRIALGWEAEMVKEGTE